ncbi:MAG: hypothetical protein KAI94_14095 [Anaerolineales bacterium]|nr:hypothetical protein [Anaerolineales bacterium]
MNKANNKPDESQIVDLLQAFQPHPSSGFYQRMEMSPWVRLKGRHKDRISITDRLLTPQFQIRAFVVIIILILVIVTGVFTAPNLIAIAQQIAQYILPAESDQLSLPFTNSTTDGPSILDSPENFSLSLSEAQDLAGLTLKKISFPIYGLTFTGAQYDPNLQAVKMRYAGGGALLLFTQRPHGIVEEYTSVGASAPIYIVKVRGVEGGWRVLSDNEEPSFTAIPGREVNLGVVWDPKLPQRILRWQEKDHIFEILLTGSHNLEKSDILKIADQIK